MESSLSCIIEILGRPKTFSPFTETMPLDLLPIAGRPLIELFLGSLEAAGFERIQVLIAHPEPNILSFIEERDSEATIDIIESDSAQISQKSAFRFYGQQYLEPRKIIRFLKFVEEHGNKLCVIPVMESQLPEAASEQTLTPISMAYFPPGIPHELPKDLPSTELKFFCPSPEPEIPIRWPWDLLRIHSILIEEMVPAMKGIIHQGATLIDPVLIEAGATIRAGAYIEGPVIIGRNCVVGPNCFLRPGTCLGNNVRVGNAVELKNTIVGDNTNIGHLSYVGDSIIGPNCNLGAGTKVANLRLDNETFKQKVGDETIETGLRKLGVFLGESVKTGINCSLMGGVSIGPGAMIGPGAIIYRNVDAHARILVRQQTEIATN